MLWNKNILFLEKNEKKKEYNSSNVIGKYRTLTNNYLSKFVVALWIRAYIQQNNNIENTQELFFFYLREHFPLRTYPKLLREKIKQS